jgi:magnesium-transporting ATPase (P-type)
MADAPQPKSIEQLEQTVKGSASWCFWIAALTGINAVLTASGSDSGFAVGTVVAQVAMVFSKASGSTAVQVVALMFNVATIAYFVVAGLFARKGHRWAFVVAILGYTVDSLLLIIAPSAIAIGFHLWALFALGVGWVSAGALRKARAQAEEGARLAAATPPPLAVPPAG